MTDPIMTITVPAWVVVIFGGLFLAQIILSAVLAYYRAKLAKLMKDQS